MKILYVHKFVKYYISKQKIDSISHERKAEKLILARVKILVAINSKEKDKGIFLLFLVKKATIFFFFYIYKFNLLSVFTRLYREGCHSVSFPPTHIS